jgi:hypothetical protein
LEGQSNERWQPPLLAPLAPPKASDVRDGGLVPQAFARLAANSKHTFFKEGRLARVNGFFTWAGSTIPSRISRLFKEWRAES